MYLFSMNSYVLDFFLYVQIIYTYVFIVINAFPVAYSIKVITIKICVQILLIIFKHYFINEYFTVNFVFVFKEIFPF